MVSYYFTLLRNQGKKKGGRRAIKAPETHLWLCWPGQSLLKITMYLCLGSFDIDAMRDVRLFMNEGVGVSKCTQGPPYEPASQTMLPQWGLLPREHQLWGTLAASGVTVEGLTENPGRLLSPQMSLVSTVSKAHSERRVLQSGAWPHQQGVNSTPWHCDVCMPMC